MAKLRIRNPLTRQVYQVPDGDQDQLTTEGWEILNNFDEEARARADTARAVIKAPPTTMDYVLSGLRSGVTETLPLLGMIGGGIVGGTAGTFGAGPVGTAVGGLAGAGLGYAAGRQANRVIGSVIGSTDPALGGTGQVPPTSNPLTMIPTVARDVAEGVVIEAASPMLGWLAKKGIEQAVRKTLRVETTPVNRGVAEAAERIGVDLPASVASGSRGVELLETAPTRFLLGPQAAKKTQDKFLRQLEGAAQTLDLEISGGTKRTLEEAGLAIQGNLRELAEAQRDAPRVLVEKLAESFAPPIRGRLALGEEVRAGAKTTETLARRQASQVYAAARGSKGLEELPLATTQRVSTSISEFESRLQGLPSRAQGPAAGLKAVSTGEEVDVLAQLTPAQFSELTSKMSREELNAFLASSQRGRPQIPEGLATEFVERYGLKEPGTRTLDEVITLMQRLRGQMRRSTDDATTRQLRQLHDALADDLVAWSAPTDAALADAARFYKREVAELFSPRAQLRRAFNKEADQIVRRILPESGIPSESFIRDVVRALPERQRQNLQASVLDTWKRRAMLDNGVVSPTKFRAEMARFGDENMTQLFGNRTPALQDLATTLEKNWGAGASNQHLARFLEANPAALPLSIAEGRLAAPSQFSEVWSLLSAETKQDVRVAMYRHVFDRSFETTGQFSPSKYLIAKEKIPQPIWDMMLTGNPAMALRDIQTVFRRSVRYGGHLTHPQAQTIFGTSQVLNSMGLGATLAYAPVGAALGAAGAPTMMALPVKLLGLFSPLALGLAVYSKAGQRALSPARPAMTLPRYTPLSVGLRGVGTTTAPER